MVDDFLLIIGAMKSGTTSLFRYLSAHPNIAPCSQKEPHFWGQENWERGLDWYRSLWDWKPETHRYALEAATSSTKQPGRPNAAARMAEVDASFKFVYSLRDPFDRIESHRAHKYLAGRLEPGGHISDIPHIIETTRYASQLAPYRAHFGRDAIHLVKFEDFVADPRREVDRIFEFLDLSADVEIPNLGENENPTRNLYRDRLIADLLKSANVVDESTIESLPAPLRTTYRLLLQREVPSPELDEDERNWVRFTLGQDIERLKREYDFDTSGWSIAG